jgi:hypothetical protein
LLGDELGELDNELPQPSVFLDQRVDAGFIDLAAQRWQIACLLLAILPLARLLLARLLLTTGARRIWLSHELISLYRRADRVRRVTASKRQGPT